MITLSLTFSVEALFYRYEFKNNHGEWVKAVEPDLGPGIKERVYEALGVTEENIDLCRSVKTELRAALTALLGVLSLSLYLSLNHFIKLSLILKNILNLQCSLVDFFHFGRTFNS